MRLVLAILFAAAPAAANPVTIGANLGAAQAKDAGTDANRTMGVFGRLGLADRVAGQLELMQMTGQPTDDIKMGNALLLIDFAKGPLVPLVVLGGGLDRERFASATFAHAEAGLGLELRTSAGFMVGADVRIGTRTVVSQQMVYYANDNSSPWLYDPQTLHAGEYRSARVTVGVTF